MKLNFRLYKKKFFWKNQMKYVMESWNHVKLKNA